METKNVKEPTDKMMLSALLKEIKELKDAQEMLILKEGIIATVLKMQDIDLLKSLKRGIDKMREPDRAISAGDSLTVAQGDG